MDGSISDLFYDEVSHTVKNHKNEVIAYWHENAWHCREDQLTSTYCSEIAQVIKKTLREVNHDPQSLIIKLKRAVSQVTKSRTVRNALVKDGAIALDLNPEDLEPVQVKLTKIFKKYKVEYSRIKNLHVSTAYLLGYNRFSDLAQLIDLISNYIFEFKITGMEVLNGATTGKDYVVLNLTAPDNFYKALKIIETESDILQFPGGFKTHISLYSVTKGSLTPAIVQELNELLVNSAFKLAHQITIKPQSISVFNDDRLLELRQKLRQGV